MTSTRNFNNRNESCRDDLKAPKWFQWWAENSLMHFTLRHLHPRHWFSSRASFIVYIFFTWLSKEMNMGWIKRCQHVDDGQSACAWINLHTPTLLWRMGVTIEDTEVNAWVSENTKNSANHSFLKPKVMTSNCLFCLIDSPKPKDIQYNITSAEEKRANPQNGESGTACSAFWVEKWLKINWLSE